MPQPLCEVGATAEASGEAATSSRPRSRGSTGYASRHQHRSGSPHAPLNEILETTSLVFEDETITVDRCKALIQELVKGAITTEERLSRIEKKLDNIVKHISSPDTYATGTAVAAAAATTPTAPGSPRKRPPLSPKTMMIEMLEDKREEQQAALDQIQDCSEESISCPECSQTISHTCFRRQHFYWCTVYKQMISGAGFCPESPPDDAPENVVRCSEVQSDMTESEAYWAEVEENALSGGAGFLDPVDSDWDDGVCAADETWDGYISG